MAWPRLDRIATLFVAGPLRKFAPDPDEGCLSILMYHRISEAPEEHLAPYYRVNTSPSRFAEQMAYLSRERYKVVDLCQALKLLETNSFTRKHVVITFDDGYRDFYTHAFPVLSEYNFTATVFLPTAYVGDKPFQFKETDCLTWGQVAELRKSGIRFGSHTVNHPKLKELDWEAVRAELSDSRKTLEEKLEEEITTFAYPYAFPEADERFVARLTELLKETGYECCVTTRIGKAMAGDDHYTLKRLPVNDCDDLSLFKAKLEGAYDWLALPQKFRKGRARKVSGAISGK